MSAKKDPYDRTSTKRQEAHLERLAGDSGRRTVVDLDGERRQKVAELRALGYAANQSEVIRKAIDEAHQRHVKA